MRPSLAMISEQSMETPTVNPVVSRPALFQEVKTYADAKTQPEPLVSSPFVEPLTPRRKLKLVKKTTPIARKELELQLMQSEHSFLPNTNTRDDAIRESDSSDDETDVDFDDASTDYDSDTFDEDWMPDEDEVESDDENPVNYQKSEKKKKKTGSRRLRNCIKRARPLC